MAPTLIALISFFAITTIIVAGFLVVRDLFGATESRAERRLAEGDSGGGSGRLQVLPVRRAGGGPVNRFDGWFSELVAQTNTQLEPLAAFLIAVAVGMGLGGALYVWHDHFVTGSIGGLAGMLIVFAVLHFLRARHRRALLEQFPDTLELLARAVRAGESLDQAIAFAGDNLAEPLATEFRRCSGQLGMGLSLDAAIRGLTSRVPLAEARILAATLIVHRRVGGNLPTMLERLAHVCRDRSNYFRQHRAATATNRGAATLIMACAVGAAAYMWIWRPEYALDFLDTPQGHVMLAVAAGLQVVGIVWVYWLLRVDY